MQKAPNPPRMQRSPPGVPSMQLLKNSWNSSNHGGLQAADHCRCKLGVLQAQPRWPPQDGRALAVCEGKHAGASCTHGWGRRPARPRGPSPGRAPPGSPRRCSPAAPRAAPPRAPPPPAHARKNTQAGERYAHRIEQPSPGMLRLDGALRYEAAECQKQRVQQPPSCPVSIRLVTSRLRACAVALPRLSRRDNQWLLGLPSRLGMVGGMMLLS